MEEFNYKFEGGSAFIEIKNDIEKTYKIQIKDLNRYAILYTCEIKGNCWARSSVFENTRLRIDVFDINDNLIFTKDEIKPPEESFYAEYFTDKYIREKFFPNFDYKGVMVEVGAGPPEFYSSSKHFRDTGWRCICIDPNPNFVEQHKKTYSEIYQYACSFEEKKCIFKIVNTKYFPKESDGMSHSAIDIKYPIELEHTIDEIPVKIIKLNTLLEELKIEKIDFISVDTEGWELEVIRGFDINKYEPKVVLLENTTHSKSYIDYMNNFDYELNHKIEYNYIFIKK